MTNFLFWPYDEVTLQILPDRTRMAITAPWAETTVPLDDDNRPLLVSLAAKFADKSLTPRDITLVNLLFKELSAFAFCYIIPTPKNVVPLDVHLLKDASLGKVPRPEFIKRVGAPEDLARKEWNWDAGSAAAFSKLKNQLHPESFFTVARRFALLEMNVEPVPDLAEVVRAALVTAEAIAGQATPLLQLVLKGFGKPTTDKVTPALLPAQKILMMAAEKNFLAFAICYDLIERNLPRTGKAASDTGNLGCSFLHFMAPVEADYALEALRLAEALAWNLDQIKRFA